MSTTRGSLQRHNGTQSFHGRVHKWKRAWVLVGEDNAATAKKRIKLLKWVRTEDRAEPSKAPRYPDLIPLDKVKELPDVEMRLVKKEEAIEAAPPKEEIVSEEEEPSTIKHASLSTGELIDLGFEAAISESTEISRDNKTQTEPLTEGTSLTVDDDDMSQNTMPSQTDEESLEGNPQLK